MQFGEKVLVGKGGSILTRHVGVGLDITQWDSLQCMEYEKTWRIWPSRAEVLVKKGVWMLWPESQC